MEPWLSARQLADAMGVTYQAIARRLFKLALFAEIDMQEIELIKERRLGPVRVTCTEHGVDGRSIRHGWRRGVASRK